MGVYPGPHDCGYGSHEHQVAEMHRLYLMNPYLNPGLTPQRLAQIQVACGHISFTMAKIFGPDFLYLSVFRRPVERVISHLRGLQREEDSRRSLADIYHEQDSKPFRYLDNVQTRFLSSTATNVPTLLHDFTPVTDASLDRARQHLAALDIVGLTEHFDDTVRLIERTSGRSLGPILHENRRASDDAVPAELRREIEANNQYDLALYDLAEQRFMQHRLAGREA